MVTLLSFSEPSGFTRYLWHQREPQCLPQATHFSVRHTAALCPSWMVCAETGDSHRQPWSVLMASALCPGSCVQSRVHLGAVAVLAVRPYRCHCPAQGPLSLLSCPRHRRTGLRCQEPPDPHPGIMLASKSRPCPAIFKQVN